MRFSPADDCVMHFLALLAHQPAMLVRVEATEGSAPREAGAWMAVFAEALIGTIGGGHLEHQAIAQARARLAGAGGSGRTGQTGQADQAGESGEAGQVGWPDAAPALVRFALGPSLGQCCGGVVQLRFAAVSARDAPALALELRPVLTPVALFGAGHVGHAVVQLLGSLPFLLTWIDSREGVFPQELLAHNLPARLLCEPSDPVQAAVPTLAPQSRVLIMSFSHAEDLEVLAACLKRQRDRADLPYIGLIGSATKWATFRRRLQARGFSDAELGHVTCPIGVPGIGGKAPEVIAVAVAAQLLQTLERP